MMIAGILKATVARLGLNRQISGCLILLTLVWLTLDCSAAEFEATPADQIRLQAGFQVERLISVPKEQGSWVSMTPDPKGRLIVSDQYGALYRVVPGSDAAETKVEKLSVDIGSAHGLLYAFDSLYVVVNGNAAEGSGLYRVRDTNGDDQFDEVRLLRKIDGNGEHGPHAPILSPDGKSIYLAAGNHTALPEIQSSRVPQVWQEDQLLPRMWDAGGHAVGRMAPGGWICRTDPEGKHFELVSSGYRNEFDIAFNKDGELFTYDADMEWDIGSPWYRPTRVCHVTSGSEFGWRSGTGKWPPYYPDSLPAVVDIGPGSPTGIAFGTGAHFPERFQNALFIADWSYGLIYAVHLEPDGSTYRGSFEQFITGSPLPVTDIVVNPQDGALYFTIGGRRTQSGLYRVTYHEPTDTGGGADDAPTADTPATIEARALRESLEALHQPGARDAIQVAWQHLSHPDRFIRFAARVAIEHQPPEKWAAKAISEQDPQASLEALVALSRVGRPGVRGDVLGALARLEWSELSEAQQLALLRAYALAFIRLGEPNTAERELVLARINQRYPARSRALNRELAQLLIFLEAPDVVSRTLELMTDARTQEDQIQYALALRSLGSGWTDQQRRQYFSWFQQTGNFRGGHSFTGFIQNIRREAIERLSESQKEALDDLVGDTFDTGEVTSPPRPFVKKWTVDELLPYVDSLSGRSFQRGRDMFAAADCFKCHRFAGEGGIIGPDLTGFSRRFDARYQLEALIDPSKVVSDQYQSTVFVMNDGRSIVGKVANLNNDQLMVITNMLEPGNMTSIRRSDIEEQMPSPVSMMPAGLLDTLDRDEVLDLIAYLRSGGDPDYPAFQK